MTDNNYQYLMNGTRLTNYSVIPNTVCEMNISSTAKVIYAKLLNRAQLSASNGFVDSLGRAYVIYTIEDLSKELGKSNSTIKDNLRELARVGLIEKKRSSKSRANMIFVKVPGTSIVGQFSACNGTENKPYKGSKTVPISGRKSAPSYSNNNKKEIPNYEYREGDSL
ncbi:MAG: replication initiator protein A [Lachnobacterium sp.]|nr:replication initiator protein A [Lachnobacterium sp.]